MGEGRRGRHARPEYSKARKRIGLAMLAGGATLLGVGCSAARTAPLVPPSTAPMAASADPTTPPSPLPSSLHPAAALTASEPMNLAIPSIGVSTSLEHLGVNGDGTIQVPPIEANAPAAWYRLSPTPGQLGPAIITGHVTVGRFGKGVFFELGTVKPGAEIDVTRADGTVAVFTVTQAVTYPKTSFPSAQVYGNVPYPGLRLITCGGALNHETDSYPDNVVVYATLVSSHHAAT